MDFMMALDLSVVICLAIIPEHTHCLFTYDICHNSTLRMYAKLMLESCLCMQIGTPQYDHEYQASKLYGYLNSTARDAYQQLTPYFWADDISEFLS